MSKPASECQEEASSGRNEPPGGARKKFRLITRGRICALLFVAMGGIGFAGYGHYTDPGPLQGERVVVVPHGGTDRVIASLQGSGVLAQGHISALFFKTVLFLTRSQGQVHAAELKFPARVSLADSLLILRHGHPVTHSLTIAEGLTARRIGTLLVQAPALKGQLPSIGEGQIAPQTFFYTWGMERTALLRHMEGLMATMLAHAWAGRDQAALDGIITSPEQLLILASLVERETSVTEERAQVARVFLNRLKQGMRLQTDPTVIYALSDGEGVLSRPLAHEDLKFESPYNTYLHEGLPPGPICSPGQETLEAVAHPAEGNALYFVATGHGGHNFAHTLAEQAQHIRSYRKAKAALH